MNAALRYRYRLGGAIALLGLAWSNPIWSAIEFTEAAGDFGSGVTFGASWGDRNGDGDPDLFLSRHASTFPSLFINEGDGTFTETATGAITDIHGTSWADFDNSGSQDYLFQVGSSSGTSSIPNKLYVNYGSYLAEEAAARGLDDPLGRGRTPLWVDWDNDGLLDIILSNQRRTDGQSPTALFLQDAQGNFSKSFEQPVRWAIGGDYASVIHLADETVPSVFVDLKFIKFWRTTYTPPVFSPRTLTGPSPTTPQDRAFADFDGDLLTDLVVTQHPSDRSELLQTSPSSVAAVMLMSSLNPDLQRATFHSPHAITLRLSGINRVRTYVGATGENLPFSADKTYVLDPLSSAGITQPVSGDHGFYIGYDVATETWEFFTFSETAWYQILVEIDSDGPIQDLVNDGIVEATAVLDSMLILWDDATGGFVDATAGSGLDLGSACQSIVAEDFDNDTDVDLYMTCTGPIENKNNRLFENLGGGVFAPVPLAGGAQGTALGRSHTVSSADYDLDGRVDLFVTNGMGPWPFNDGVNQLFRNTTSNANHWIEIDLEGVESNRDGVGARIWLTADGVSQVRTHSGGMHKYAQDFNRTHFGLGASETVDAITVNWPSGIETSVTDVAADQVIALIEVEAPEPTATSMLLASIATLVLLRRMSGRSPSA